MAQSRMLHTSGKNVAAGTSLVDPDARQVVPFTVLVCRACCCGRASKHPEIDHDLQVEQIRAAVALLADARFRVVDCLDVCARSNVVVIRDRRLETAPERRSLWLGGITTDSLTVALCDWIATGGPASALPFALTALRFPGPAKDVPAALQDEDCDRPIRRRLTVR